MPKRAAPSTPVRANTVHGLVEFRERPVPKLCHNPMDLRRLDLLFERAQVLSVVYIRHFRVESMEHLEPRNILRNQQVAARQVMQGDLGSTSPKARLLAIARTARRKITSPVDSSGDSFSLDESCLPEKLRSR